MGRAERGNKAEMKWEQGRGGQNMAVMGRMGESDSGRDGFSAGSSYRILTPFLDQIPQSKPMHTCGRSAVKPYVRANAPLHKGDLHNCPNTIGKGAMVAFLAALHW